MNRSIRCTAARRMGALCRQLVVPKLQSASCDDAPHVIAEQRSITDGRIVPMGRGFTRKPPKRVDDLLWYARDFPLAVVETKAVYKAAADRMSGLSKTLRCWA